MTRRQGKCEKPTCDRKQQNGGYCKLHYRLVMQAKGISTGLVDSAPVLAHIQELTAAGISQKRLGQLVGMQQSSIWRLITSAPTRMLAATADKILAVPVPNEAWKVSHPNAQLPALGCQRRLRALMRVGYTSQYLGDRVGIRKESIVAITSGAQTHVTARTAAKVAIMFDALRLTTGTSALTITRSRKKGWPPPSAWDVDEIDSPNAQPIKPGREDFAEIIADYRTVGRTDDEIASALGVSIESLYRRLNYHKIPLGKRYRDIEEHMDMKRNNTMSKRSLKVS